MRSSVFILRGYALGKHVLDRIPPQTHSRGLCVVKMVLSDANVLNGTVSQGGMTLFRRRAKYWGSSANPRRGSQSPRLRLSRRKTRATTIS
jgi:hypothetical protein